MLSLTLLPLCLPRRDDFVLPPLLHHLPLRHDLFTAVFLVSTPLGNPLLLTDFLLTIRIWQRQWDVTPMTMLCKTPFSLPPSPSAPATPSLLLPLEKQPA